MKIYLIRHGQTDANTRKIFSGWTDARLTDLGRRQAKEAADKLRDIRFDAMYSSDLSRARETAETVRAERALDIQTLEGLRERNFGDWEGVPFDELAERDPVIWRRFLENRAGDDVIPGSEPRAAFHSRVVAAYRDILSRHDLDSDETICIVAHAGTLMTLLSEIVYGDDTGYFRFEIQNSKINLIEYVMRYPVIKAINA